MGEGGLALYEAWGRGGASQWMADKRRTMRKRERAVENKDKKKTTPEDETSCSVFCSALFPPPLSFHPVRAPMFSFGVLPSLFCFVSPQRKREREREGKHVTKKMNVLRCFARRSHTHTHNPSRHAATHEPRTTRGCIGEKKGEATSYERET